MTILVLQVMFQVYVKRGIGFINYTHGAGKKLRQVCVDALEGEQVLCQRISQAEDDLVEWHGKIARPRR